MGLLENVLLGSIQGIAEWLPVSSEGLIVLASSIFLSLSVVDSVRLALFLHLGTFFSALIYFRADVSKILNSVLKYESSGEDKSIIKFLFVATVVSSVIGLLFLLFLKSFESSFALAAGPVTIVIGILLLFTAYVLRKAKTIGDRSSVDLNLYDGIVLGIAQGLAILPGVSRSGMTVSLLLLRKFDKSESLRISFLMSLPAVLLGNIALNIMEPISFSIDSLAGLFFSFVFGIMTIHGLITVSKKINFSLFVTLFGILVVVSGVFIL